MKSANVPEICIRAVALAGGVAFLLSIFRAMPARGALSTDQQALVSIANATVTGSAGSDQGLVSGIAIDGNWALISWTDNNESGGEIVASKASGTWQPVRGGGGSYRASDLVQLAGVDNTTAAFLVANLRPLPHVGGSSNAISGTSTHQLVHENCITDTSPPRRYSCSYIPDPSSTATFQTGSITPLGPSSAVVADVTVTSGTAVVSLYGPTGNLIQQNTLTSGQTGGVGYISPDAQTGSYTVTVAGAVSASEDPGGSYVSTSTYTDALWTGSFSW